MENMLTTQDWSSMNNMISNIHSSTPYPNLVMVIRDLKELISFSHSLSCLISDSNEKIEFFHYQSDNIPIEHINLYCSHYIYYDFILWYAATPRPMAFRETDIIAEKHMADSIFMKEWMNPINAYYGAMVNIAAISHSYGNICLYKSKEEGDFSDRDIAILKIINDHLSIRYKELFPKGIQRSSFSNNSYNFKSTYHLTQRESEIVNMICEGTLRQDLSKELFISENTVKKHLNSIYKKIGVINFEGLLRIVKPGISYFK